MSFPAAASAAAAAVCRSSAAPVCVRAAAAGCSVGPCVPVRQKGWLGCLPGIPRGATLEQAGVFPPSVRVPAPLLTARFSPAACFSKEEPQSAAGTWPRARRGRLFAPLWTHPLRNPAPRNGLRGISLRAPAFRSTERNEGPQAAADPRRASPRDQCGLDGRAMAIGSDAGTLGDRRMQRLSRPPWCCNYLILPSNSSSRTL